MPTINFPLSPVIDQLYVFGGKTWKFNGASWLLVVQNPMGREVLTANRTYYVATTGNDNNSGLSAAAPFLTGQRAVDVAAALDMSIYDVTIQLADGTYTAPIICKQGAGAGKITIQGNSITPTNVFLNSTAPAVIDAVNISTKYFVTGVKLQASAGTCLSSQGYGTVLTYGNVVFGTALNGYHLGAAYGGQIQCNGNYSITGGALAHWAVTYGNLTCNSKTITITGTPNFSQAFALSARAAGVFDIFGNTFSGSATGIRYNISANAVCFTNLAGATYLPGNAAGSATTGAQYI